jgi:hypothetical protein
MSGLISESHQLCLCRFCNHACNTFVHPANPFNIFAVSVVECLWLVHATKIPDSNISTSASQSEFLCSWAREQDAGIRESETRRSNLLEFLTCLKLHAKPLIVLRYINSSCVRTEDEGKGWSPKVKPESVHSTLKPVVCDSD